MGAGTIDVTPIPCVCGRGRCSQRNRHHFLTVVGADRVRVFLDRTKDGPAFWTWCPVRNGHVVEWSWLMGHYDTQQRAHEDAQRFTLGLPSREETKLWPTP